MRAALRHRKLRLRSAAARALRVHIQRVKAVARRHEKPVAMTPAEAHVRATLRQCNMADRLALRREDAHAVEFVGAHAPTAPQVPVDVDAKTIRRAWACI